MILAALIIAGSVGGSLIVAYVIHEMGSGPSAERLGLIDRMGGDDAVSR